MKALVSTFFMETTLSPTPIYAGEFRHAIDPKGRVTVPSKWRREEGDDFYIIPNPDNECLLIMPPEEFKAIGRKVESNTAMSETAKRVFFRTFYSQAQPSTVDKQGRMLLPEEYCKRVGLGEDVVLAGGDVRFEIWNPDRWKTTIEEKRNVYSDVANSIGL